MELSLPLVSYETLAAAVLAARPTAVDGTQGVDITGWRAFAGAYAPVNATGYIQQNGADVTLSPFGGNATGVELWGMKARKSGTKYWWLEGNINGTNPIIVAGAGGFAFPLVLSTIYDRLAVVGLSSNVGAIPTVFFEPIEHIMQFVS